MSKYILIAGAVNMDIVIKTDNLPQKGQSINGDSLNFFPGGKGANQAITSSRMGSESAFIGKVGKDSYGDQLTNLLKSEKLNIEGLGKSEKPTGIAIITVDKKGDNTIVCAQGASVDITTDYIKSQAKLIKNANIVVSTFEFPTESVNELFTIAKKNRKTTILNPAPAFKIPSALLAKTDYLILNETELAFIVSKSRLPEKIEEIAKAAETVRIQGPSAVIVTLGSKGALTITKEEIIRTEGIKVIAKDTTAAGDCFIGAFASQINKGASLKESVEFANKIAALSVQKSGASSSIPKLKDIAFH